MTAERVYRTSHSIDISAPAGIVYGLLTDAVHWPLFLEPDVHVERLERDGTDERLRMWAFTGDSLRSWICLRVLDPLTRRVEFHHSPPQPPVKAMRGTWAVEELPGHLSRLTVLHDFTVHGGLTHEAQQVEQAVASTSRAELAGLKKAAERWRRLDDVVLCFEETVRVDAPADAVHAFLHRAGHWARLLPHVSRVRLEEPVSGIQTLTVDTLAQTGATQTTESVRICFPHAGRIVYKQTVTPPLLEAHTGEWSVRSDAAGTIATAQHSVVLCEEAVPRVLGPCADLAQARRHVRETLGRASAATLEAARRHTETGWNARQG
ncbi:aromatase/cyclase [Streptomyces sp. CHA1]|uniref:aromatase/cyclase n=1 Tax=Streptomyces TaxID=1883 RepID=UPI0020954BBA|nr:MULTISPECIES: aromatase/cyclase [unclassified Streptomyces]MCO6716742.1 aromatase/cyclase [Streptomyces sp. CHB19.2]MCO6728789.1 aromatase/cyclase [Streptomyces sp. CHA16]MCO6729307.1 aromatase/cyclase [Streptomyces sp. EL9]UUD66324.1 aromatase/cyclase [Streptomyces sp. G11C(2021)]MCO6704601.1 aromatase/cyclase [Streptomyces sp. CHB9.2]